ncbi:MAG: hypothetical protein COT73_05575 [Bdellovibrio sp. CG10_big_fil_rev_8_21_14_0_10_47_8]|nr:MAG: hypothetical protein COT73_05575 [Bdellovibrio sp. CG10_big_fil_rev_8_21_14_0_10_47_8]
MNNLSLNDKLKCIGFRLSGGSAIKKNSEWVDIERTLYEASLAVAEDSRLLSLLCSWVSVHGDRVIIEKLMRLQREKPSVWLVAIAVFGFEQGFHKWKRLIKRQKNRVYLIDESLALSAIELKGIEPGMGKYNLMVPRGAIRARERDVLTERELIGINKQYRNRVMFGAAIRADIMTAIEAGIKTPYAIAKIVGCSYEPAHRVFREYQLLNDLKAG